MELSKGEMEALCKTMANSLPLFRAKLGLSQEQLAHRLDITRQTISAFESGQREMPWSMFLAFLMLFSVSPSTEKLLEAMGIMNDTLSAFLKNEYY